MSDHARALTFAAVNAETFARCVDLGFEVADDVLADVELIARAELDSLPVPAFRLGAQELAARRTRLEALLGVVDARRGDASRLVATARRRWVSGSSHVEYLELLDRVGRREHALELACSLLDDASMLESSAQTREVIGRERDGVHAFVVSALGLPARTSDALRALASAPSLATWLDLTRFWPASTRDGRVRYAVSTLLELGADPAIVFALAASERSDAHAMRLAATGLVVPASIVALAAELSRERRAAYYGMAFRAAVVRGQSFVAVRSRREAREAGRSVDDLESDRQFAEARGSDVVRRALALGLPSSCPRDFDA